MLLAPLRWLARNLSTLILAFLLAVVVWVSAVITADPNEENTYRPVSIEIIGKRQDLLLVNDIPLTTRLTLRAPKSIWDKLNNDPTLVRAWIDLSGLGAGEHEVEVKTRVDASPIRYVQVDPAQAHLVLEPLVVRDFAVQLIENGELPMGYKKGLPVATPDTVTISGPESAVQKVAVVRAILDITGAIESINRTIEVEVVDKTGHSVPEVTVEPKNITVAQPITLLGGFKNVVIRVVTKSQVANGFRLTNISVTPPTVTIFSDNPELIQEMPGFVDTLPVDLANLRDDIEINVGLNLPEGVTPVRDPSVLVQVSVAAIEGSMKLTIPVEVIGLSPELEATISPAAVDVIVAGPLDILDGLTPSSFRVILDLTGLPPGVYQRAPVVDLLPDQVRVQTIIPETVEVNIVLAPTPTPTPTEPLTPQPSLTPLITPTPKR
jgi:YbbR domain-containing protein